MPQPPYVPHPQKRMGFLAFGAKLGSRLPDMTILFIAFFFITCLFSLLLSPVEFRYINPATNTPLRIVNMFSLSALAGFTSKIVSNYAGFPALTMVLVATFGVGILDGSGYLKIALRKILSVTPARAVSPVIILVSILAPDSGCVLLIPIAASLFYNAGRHPLAGIAAAFSGIAAAFVAGYTPSGIDPILQSFTQSAAQLITPSYRVNVLCNFYYGIIAATCFIPISWFITDKIVEPWLWENCPLKDDFKKATACPRPFSKRENRAFYVASALFFLLLAGLFLSLMPPDSPFRAPDGEITSYSAPVMQSIVGFIFLFSAFTGVAYGILSGNFAAAENFTDALEETTHSVAKIMVFYFFAAQFLYVFKASHIGPLIALVGADLLRILALPPQITIFLLLIFVTFLNAMVTSAAAKWAVLAPIFVPMLMHTGISPELVQVVFRISDASTNAIVPTYAFYPLIVTCCQKYTKNNSAGALSSMMLPYTLALFICFMTILYAMWALQIPLGPDSLYNIKEFFGYVATSSLQS